MKRDIALALSGGGFRASYFHLGVMQQLHKLGLLERVGLISSVSGGSILAGIYATSLLNDESFDTFVARALQFLNRKKPLDWPAMLHDLSPVSKSSKGLEDRYLEEYRCDGQPIRMKDLKKLPLKFAINSTAVHSGIGWRFLSDGNAEHWQLGHNHNMAFDTRVTGYRCNVTLARAVAASSAFPTFTAVTLQADEIGKSSKEPLDPEIVGIVPHVPSVLPKPLCLSDGGVLDNMGVTSILGRCRPAEAEEDYYLISSDAGAVGKILDTPPNGRVRKISYLMRQFDMRGQHNNAITAFLVLSHHRKNTPPKTFALLNMIEAVPHAGETLESVAKLTAIPTRLKRIDKTSQEASLDPGYGVSDGTATRGAMDAGRNAEKSQGRLGVRLSTVQRMFLERSKYDDP